MQHIILWISDHLVRSTRFHCLLLLLQSLSLSLHIRWHNSTICSFNLVWFSVGCSLTIQFHWYLYERRTQCHMRLRQVDLLNLPIVPKLNLPIHKNQKQLILVNHTLFSTEFDSNWDQSNWCEYAKYRKLKHHFVACHFVSVGVVSSPPLDVISQLFFNRLKRLHWIRTLIAIMPHWQSYQRR